MTKCVPCDKDLISRLRDFTLNKACKEDAERAITWLMVRLRRHRVSYIYLRGVLQMDSNIPKDVLVRWKTYGFERHPLHHGIWDRLLSGQCYVFGGMTAAAMSISSSLNI